MLIVNNLVKCNDYNDLGGWVFQVHLEKILTRIYLARIFLYIFFLIIVINGLST